MLNTTLATDVTSASIPATTTPASTYRESPTLNQPVTVKVEPIGKPVPAIAKLANLDAKAGKPSAPKVGRPACKPGEYIMPDGFKLPSLTKASDGKGFVKPSKDAWIEAYAAFATHHIAKDLSALKASHPGDVADRVCMMILNDAEVSRVFARWMLALPIDHKWADVDEKTEAVGDYGLCGRRARSQRMHRRVRQIAVNLLRDKCKVTCTMKGKAWRNPLLDAAPAKK